MIGIVHGGALNPQLIVYANNVNLGEPFEYMIEARLLEEGVLETEF